MKKNTETIVLAVLVIVLVIGAVATATYYGQGEELQGLTRLDDTTEKSYTPPSDPVFEDPNAPIFDPNAGAGTDPYVELAMKEKDKFLNADGSCKDVDPYVLFDSAVYEAGQGFDGVKTFINTLMGEAYANSDNDCMILFANAKHRYPAVMKAMNYDEYSNGLQYAFITTVSPDGIEGMNYNHPDKFYMELIFNLDPEMAKLSVHWNLRHAGLITVSKKNEYDLISDNEDFLVLVGKRSQIISLIGKDYYFEGIN